MVQRSLQTHQPYIELRHLRYFLAVVEELHFGRAAERLHIAGPPLSQAIRKLEDELGVLLFNRSNRAVTVTEAGATLAQQAVAVFAAFNLAVEETRRAGGSSDGLRTGCIPLLSLPRLQAFLAALAASDSGVRPQVAHLEFAEQVARLRSAELDIAIFHDVGEIDRVEVQPLFAGEPLGVFVRTGHPLAGRRSVGPDDLRSETLVTFPRAENPALHDRVLEILEDAGFSFAAVREATSTHARDVMLAVADGVGVAFEPLSLASASEARALVCCRLLDSLVLMPDTVVGWRANPPRHLGALLTSVRDVARMLRATSSPRRLASSLPEFGRTSSGIA
jgi:DNA-binding transcriptional LysR family regulator